MTGDIACAILAAGASRRLGQPKQLVLVRGRPLIERAAAAGCDSECVATAVVVGAHAPRVMSAVQNISVQVIFNQEWREGMGASIRCAVRWASQSRFDGLVVAVCDQPRLDSAHINALVRRFRESHLLVASRYSAKRGVPVLFPARYFHALTEMTGDRGASTLVQNACDVTEVEWPPGAYDLDWPMQLHELE